MSLQGERTNYSRTSVLRPLSWAATSKSRLHQFDRKTQGRLYTNFQWINFTLGPAYNEFGYNEQIYLHQNHWLQCEIVKLQRAPT